MRRVWTILLACTLLVTGMPIINQPVTVQAEEVSKPLTSISLDQEYVKLQPGETYSLQMSCEPSDTTDTIEWGSTDKTVAMVDESGTITAVKTGEAKIVATNGSVSAICAVTVYVATTGVKINADKTKIFIDDEPLKVSATREPAGSTGGLKWENSNDNVAQMIESIYSIGVTLKPVKPGTLTLTTTVYNTVTDEVPITDSMEFEVTNSIEMTNANVLGSDLYYDGTAQEPYLDVTYGDKTYGFYTDYDIVGYENNINAGTATVTIEGIGNYSGTKTIEYLINPANLDQYGIEIEVNSKPAEKTSTDTADYGLDDDDDYDDDLDDYDEETEYYTGKDITRDVVVHDNGVLLVEGTDYTVEYANNREPGEATITIAGINNYCGSVTKTFDIVKRNIRMLSLTADKTVVATGSTVRPKIQIKHGDYVLKENVDYKVEETDYGTNISCGTGSVTISGMGDHYNGSRKVTFTIIPMSASSFNVKVDTKDAVYYYGTEICPEVVVTCNGVTLKKWNDYTVTYKNNKNAGTATAVITFSGAYQGNTTINKTFTIKPAAIKTISWQNDTSYKYNGKGCKPAVYGVYGGDKELVDTSNYTITYKNNVNAGTASLVVTGKGNYSGTVTKNFTIAKASQTISASKKEMVLGDSVALGAKRTSGNGALSYTSSEPGVASISSSGKLTAKKIGTTTITIKAAGTTNYKGASKKVTVNVNPKATKLTKLTSTKNDCITVKWNKVSGVSGYEILTQIGVSYNTIHMVKGSASQSVTLKNLMGGKEYTVKIRSYKIIGSKKYYSKWSEEKDIDAMYVHLSDTKLNLNKGTSQNLSLFGTTKKVTWKSSNTAVATVSKSGKVTAKKNGKATITATVEDNVSKCSVVVFTKNPELNKQKLSLDITTTYNLELKYGTAKSWSSADKSIATVNAKGVVTPKKKGTTIITCKDKKGKKYTCKVTVKYPNITMEAKSIVYVMLDHRRCYAIKYKVVNHTGYDCKFQEQLVTYSEGSPSKTITKMYMSMDMSLLEIPTESSTYSLQAGKSRTVYGIIGYGDYPKLTSRGITVARLKLNGSQYTIAFDGKGKIGLMKKVK